VQKLVVAWPLYRQVPVSWLFNWTQMERRHGVNVVAVVGTEAMYLPMAMHELINQAFKECPDFDRLVVFEHDMIPPVDAFERIAEYRDEHDIVGTMYFKHDWPHHVMAWMQVQPPFYSPLTAEITKQMVDTPALYEVDAVAMGFTAIRRQVFEQWDRDIPMWDPIPPLIGHDLHFCNEAKKQGFKVWVDSGIGCGHLTLVPIGYPHSQEALAVANPTRWTEGGVPTEEG
jgi:hypothetical protein